MIKFILRFLKLTIIALVLGSTIQCFAATPGVLTFGLSYFYPPFVMFDSQQKPYGFDVDLANHICKELKVTCKFKAMRYHQLFSSLHDQKIDAAISAITITKTRKKDFRFSNPYFPSYASFVVNRKSEGLDILTPEKLRNRNIGVTSGTIFLPYLKNYYPYSNIKIYSHVEDLIQGLADHEVDVILMDSLAAQYWVFQNHKKFRFLGRSIRIGDGLGIAVHKKNPQLLQAINTALAKMMRDGNYKRITNTYFGYTGLELN